MNYLKKVHLGCGNKIMKDWINVDVIKKEGILTHDLSKKLPFDDCSVDFFFSEHFLEHLSRNEGLYHLKEIYRCLKVGGVSRIVVPDLDYLVTNYANDNMKAYSETTWQPRSRCDMMNTGITGWGHKYMYNAEELRLSHEIAGFVEILFTIPHYSTYKELSCIGVRNSRSDISVEAKK